MTRTDRGKRRLNSGPNWTQSTDITVQTRGLQAFS